MPFNRRFIVFLFGSFFASFGGWINFLTILNLATWRFNARPFDFVLLSAALLLPSVLLTRTVARVCNRGRGATVIVMALAVTLVTTTLLMEAESLPVFLAIVALKSAALAFVDPAETRYVAMTLAGERQSRAFRYLAFLQNVSKICAPAAGALFGSWMGDGRTLLLSIAMILAAIVLISLSTSWRAQAGDEQQHQNQKAEPAKIQGALAPLLWCATIVFAMSAAINNQFPLMLKMHGFEGSVLGLLVSCAAIGGMAGSALPVRNERGHNGLYRLLIPALMSASAFVAIGGIFRIPLYPAHFLLAAAFFVTGLVGAHFKVNCRIYIAQRIPTDVAGASARLQSRAMLAQFLAPCGGAVLTSHLSGSNVFISLGISAVVGLCLVWWLFVPAGGADFGYRLRRRSMPNRQILSQSSTNEIPQAAAD